MSRIISYGISVERNKKKAVLLENPAWVETLERCRKSFGLENVSYEYWSYPAPNPEGSIWIRNNKSVVMFLSEGFLKIATEPQVVTMMESLNANTFHVTRRKNKKQAIRYLFNGWKGGSGRYRYWILSFFLYPLERMLKVAKI
jgi:hypothetical protein